MIDDMGFFEEEAERIMALIRKQEITEKEIDEIRWYAHTHRKIRPLLEEYFLRFHSGG